MILELLLNGNAPAAIVLCHTDEIIALGAIVAEELFNKKLPVLCLEAHLQKHAITVCRYAHAIAINHVQLFVWLCNVMVI